MTQHSQSQNQSHLSLLITNIGNTILVLRGRTRCYSLSTLRGLFLLVNLFASNAQADWEYYWWNKSGFNCLGPWSPGGPSFHTNSLQGTISLTLQKSVETNLSNPGYCITLIRLEPSGSPFFDDSNTQYPWVIPVHGQTGPGGSYRYFDDLIRLRGTGESPKNAGLTCSSVGNPINPGIGNKFDQANDYLMSSKKMNLSFDRIYNSKSLYVLHDIGWGWTHNFSAHLALSPSGKTVSMARDDGKIFTFKLVGSNWLPDTDVSDRLLELKNLAGGRTGWSYTTVDNSVETYNTSGKLVSIADSSGLTQTLVYSDASTPVAIAPTAGLLLRVADSFGHQLSFTYDASSRISTLTDPAGGLYRYAYDTNNNLVSVTYPDRASKTYHYENTAFPHALTGVTDENNHRYATYTYDVQGRGLSTEHAAGAERVSLVYNADGSTTVTDALNTARTYQFQTILGVVKSKGQSQPGGSGCNASALALTYDANGNVTSRTDFNGNRTNYSYDLTRNLETSRTEGLTSTGATTPATRTITTVWHPTFRLPVQITNGNQQTTYAYNSQGDLTDKTVKDLTANTTRSWHTTYTYGSVPGVLLQKVEDGPRTDVSDLTTYDYYSADASCTGGHLGCRGQLQQFTDALGHTTQLNRYNAHGQVEQLTDPNGLVTTLTYDQRQRLTSLDSGGEMTTYAYDPAGQLTRITRPDASYLTHSYDAAHRLVKTQDDQGNSLSYTLDALGNRLKEEAHDPNGQLARSQSRVYDALSRLQNLTLPQ